jgi:hypothetical protein
MITLLLIVHGLLAVLLIGAITHQAISVSWPNRLRATSFVASVRSVNGLTYTNAIIVLFLVTAILGCFIYPEYRLRVRTVLQRLQMFGPEGSFELKEHVVSIGAALLPAYWYFWRQPLSDAHRTTRMALTVLLAAVVWWAFLVGHVLNNIRGFGS